MITIPVRGVFSSPSREHQQRARGDRCSEDLILSKLVWMKESGSEMQRRDVARVVQDVGGLDRVYIERWAQELGVTTLWHEIAGKGR